MGHIQPDHHQTSVAQCLPDANHHRLTFGVPPSDLYRSGAWLYRCRYQSAHAQLGPMVGEYQTYLRSYWYLATFPSIAIGLTMLAFSLPGRRVAMPGSA
ncbi:MAG: hypothetical protein R2867_33950 [Caldilineaceae bacterium]